MGTHTPTPRPWIATVSGKQMHGYCQPYAIAQRSEANLIAGCFGDVAGGKETAQANAAHIVKCVNGWDEQQAKIDELALEHIPTTQAH